MGKSTGKQERRYKNRIWEGEKKRNLKNLDRKRRKEEKREKENNIGNMRTEKGKKRINKKSSRRTKFILSQEVQKTQGKAEGKELREIHGEKTIRRQIKEKEILCFGTLRV